MEIVYKRRLGPEYMGEYRSKHKDGLYGWRKWARRGQESIDEWELDDHDGIRGFWQGWKGSANSVFIPIEKALLFRTSSVTPAGRSCLRNAIWAIEGKRHLRTVQGIAFERELTGVPLGRAPAQVMAGDASADEKAANEAFQKQLVNLRLDEQAALELPSDLWEGSATVRQWDIELLKSPGQRSMDIGQAIGSYNAEITMSLQADFMLLGHSGTGSYNLGTAKIELFTNALDGWLNNIAAVINDHAIPRILRMNGFDATRQPTLRHEGARGVDLMKLGTFIQQIGGANVLTPDDAMENALRAKAGLPEFEGVRPVELRTEENKTRPNRGQNQSNPQQSGGDSTRASE